MKIYTCTPAHFYGGPSFFCRDTGLLSDGFRTLGVESRPVMLGPPLHGDEGRILRVSRAKMGDVRWWRRQSLDGLVLYSWALPQFNDIARAIHEAQIPLLIYIDSAGLWSPRVQKNDYCRALWAYKIRNQGVIRGPWLFLASLLKNLIPGLMDRPRLQHLSYANIVGVPSPLALMRTVSFAKHYQALDLIPKLQCLGAPVSPSMRYTGIPKQKLAICVGRWTLKDWPQKDPKLLLRAASAFLKMCPDYEVVIVGPGHEDLLSRSWARREIARSPGIRIVGPLSSEQVSNYLDRARISLCTSPSEAAHLASMEAVCCGCSVVAVDSPALPIFPWLGENNGSFSADRSADSFAKAMQMEAMAWEEGRRNPLQTSRKWTQLFLAEKMAEKIMQLLKLTTQS